jgi:hypothetical protein
LTSYHSRISEISDVRQVLFVSTLRLQVLAVQTKPEVSFSNGERSFILRSENDKLYRRNRRHILKTGENVFQKQETQFDNYFPISENANDTNTRQINLN